MVTQKNWGGREENQPAPLCFFFHSQLLISHLTEKLKKQHFSRSVGARCKDMNDVWLEACHAASSAFYTQHPLILKKERQSS